MRQDLSFCSADWPGTHCLAQADPELLSVLPQLVKCWDYRHKPLYSAKVILIIYVNYWNFSYSNLIFEII